MIKNEKQANYTDNRNINILRGISDCQWCF